MSISSVRINDLCLLTLLSSDWPYTDIAVPFVAWDDISVICSAQTTDEKKNSNILCQKNADICCEIHRKDGRGYCCCRRHFRGDQIFFSATCPGQVACKNPLVLRNFLLVPKYFSNRKSIGQVANTTISLPLNQSCRSGSSDV